jgi:hypothetical protein
LTFPGNFGPENYTFSLIDFIYRCFQSRASLAQTAQERKRLAVPAMSRSSDDKSKSKTIEEKQIERALKTAGLKTVPQQSNMTEWIVFRKCLDVQEDIGTLGGRTCFKQSSLLQPSARPATERMTLRSRRA